MSDRKYNLAILGATGNVGRLLLDLVEQRNFPINKLKLLASERSAGSTITSSQGKEYKVELACDEAFQDMMDGGWSQGLKAIKGICERD